MKSSELFKKKIEDYLTDKVSKDKLFEKFFNNPEKNIEDCVTYILNTVKESGMNAFEEIEIFSMVVHYYEEDVKVGPKINCRVVGSQLSSEEVQEAKKMVQKHPKQVPSIQQSLF